MIQGGSLFPHMTVDQEHRDRAEDAGLGPRRGSSSGSTSCSTWSASTPASYRDRYPRELSGGQQQRVGVARGLAADPPVILMDEPFGAVDPITRQRLQDELLSIQRELRKTIVCVTHDIDEAIKLGDRILILQEGAQVAQYDTPEVILGAPANEFVDDFVGAGLLAQAAQPGPDLRGRAAQAAPPRRSARRSTEVRQRAEASRRPQRRRPRRPRPAAWAGRGCASSRATPSSSRPRTWSTSTTGPRSTTPSTRC